MSLNGRATLWVIIGDIICALVLSLVGFITHYGTLEGWRWLTTFIPVLISWFLIAPWLGNFREDVFHRPFRSWRAALAAAFAAPLAAWLRGGLLNSPILPLFILVLALTNALGFLIWRIIISSVFWWKNRYG